MSLTPRQLHLLENPPRFTPEHLEWVEANLANLQQSVDKNVLKTSMEDNHFSAGSRHGMRTVALNMQSAIEQQEGR